MTSISETKRLKVFGKYNGKCAYCGCDLSFFEMTIDHIKPRSSGGKNNLENLNPSCRACNLLKGHLSVRKFTALVRELERTGEYRVYFDNRISKSILYFRHFNFERYSTRPRANGEENIA